MNKVFPYVAGMILFVLLSCVYCRPQFSGKRIIAEDSVSSIAGAKEGALYTRETGDVTFWSDRMFCGMPNYQLGGHRYKADALLSPLENVLHLGHSGPAWILLTYFICFFILLKSFGVGVWLSIIGAILTGFSTDFITIIAAGHFGKCTTIALMCVVFAGFRFIFQKRYGLGIVLTMVFSSIGFGVHPQMSYYVCMLIGVCFLSEVFIHLKERRWKDLLLGTVLFAAAMCVGLGTRSSSHFANVEYLGETMRGNDSSAGAQADDGTASKGLDIDYATAWSYGIDETLSLLVPRALGGGENSSFKPGGTVYREMVSRGADPAEARRFCKGVTPYWGKQPFTVGDAYVGAIVFFLFVLGLIVVKGPCKWALLFATAMSIILAWGSNFMPLTKFFFYHFPMYGKFRAVNSILIVASITIPILGTLGVKELLSGVMSQREKRRSVMTAGLVTMGICLFFALFGRLVFSFKSSHDAAWLTGVPGWLYAAVSRERWELMRSDCWRSILLVGVAMFTMLLAINCRLKTAVAGVIVGALAVADLWIIDRDYLNDSCYESRRSLRKEFEMTPWEERISSDTSCFRVLNAAGGTWNDYHTSLFYNSLGGYSAVKLRRYNDLIENHLKPLHWPVVNMLNAKYLFRKTPSGETVASYNSGAMGNAWFVGKVHVALDAAAESEALTKIDLRQEAVTDRTFASMISDLNPGVAPDAFVRLTGHNSKERFYECRSSAPGVIVFSEIYYPYGWKAFVDGQPASHYRVNYVLRAMDVPAGSHRIHFIFDPDSVKKGNAVAIFFIIVMYLTIVVVAAWAFVSFRRKKSGNA